MANIVLLYEPLSDRATLSGGSWSLPLANLQKRRLKQVTRSANLNAASTRFEILLLEDASPRGMVLSNLNVTTAYQYRLKAFDDGGTEIYSSGLVTPLDADVEIDPKRGVALAHVFDENVTSKRWSVELLDPGNPDGFVEAGRLLLANGWSPSRNYDYSGNGLGFVNNAQSATTLSGGKVFSRRVNPRRFPFQFGTLPENETFDQALRLNWIAGYDGEVFVIPDPDETPNRRLWRSFLGTVTQMDALSQSMFQHVGTAYEITEII